MPRPDELARYADIIVQVGANIRAGQPVTVTAQTDTAPFVRILAERLYAAGAGIVRVNWYDPICQRLTLERAAETRLENVPGWEPQRRLEEIDENSALVYVDAEDPDLLNGVDESRVALAHKARGRAFKASDDRVMADEVTWNVCATPSAPWARKMFPEITDDNQAVEALWQTLMRVMRAHEGDPVGAWRQHFDDLERRAGFLNSHRFRRLHYRAPGTDLHLEMPPLHLWSAARSTNAQGQTFAANLPTEEVYTLPARGGAEGTVRATMPLVYHGVVIEDIQVTFQAGRVVDFRCSTGYETLRQLIETDEGSHYLGEVALVPVTSPIAQEGRLFYSTLFDENASCHLALGHAYPTCLEGGRDMTEQQLAAAGLNDSISHVDFMIGSKELDIDGETPSGEMLPVMRQGLWAF